MPDPRPQDFTRSTLEEYVFPGTDAAVVFIPEGEGAAIEVKEVLERSGQQRWYPIPGGHRVKVPFHYAEDRKELFEREAKGWDHEHCDFCNANISIGELSWTVPDARGVLVFCGKCYEKVPMKKKWWRFGW